MQLSMKTIYLILALALFTTSQLTAGIFNANIIVRAELTGWLGGFSLQDDHAILTVIFFSAGNANLGQMNIGPVLAADRTNLTCFLFRAATNTLPVGTRLIQLVLNMTRDEGNYNDRYADDLSLILRDQPVLQISSLGKSTLISWSTNNPG